jgi:outer membrane protein OmpA-like peptidoglycan-associated protein
MERIILLFLVLTSNFSIAQTSKSYTFNFALNKVKPISTSFSTLDSTITILQKQYKIISIQIDAHTDSKGSEKYNIKLSGERAQYIYEQIINSGFEESKINKNAWGESKPLFSNKKLSHKNRRVEIVFLLEEKSGSIVNLVKRYNKTKI